MITIIDGIGNNIRSICSALNALNAEFTVTQDIPTLQQATKIILPGVGSFDQAMQLITQRNLVDVIRNATVPVLGICVGMQLLYACSDESDQLGLGILPGTVNKITDNPRVIVPHTGWNTLQLTTANPLLAGITTDDYVYFVHSFAAKITPNTIATCDYGRTFTAAVAKDHFFGVQFHPEKSARVGKQILSNFLEMSS